MLVVLRAQEHPRARLICFPHAGGSAAAYRSWDLPPEFELCAIQPPGRSSRYAEEELASLNQLRDEVIEALRPTLDNGVPFAFFGHSFGSIVAFEVARGIAERSLTAPLAIFVSAAPAPGIALPDSQARLSQTPTDEDLLEGLRVWDFAPDTLTDGADQELQALTVPPIRADLAMREQYCAMAASRAESGSEVFPRLDTPLHTFGGRHDRSCEHADLLAWEAYAPLSSASDGSVHGAADAMRSELFSCTMLSGGHFYLDARESRELLIENICARVHAALRTRAASLCEGPLLSCARAAELTYVHELIEERARGQPEAVAVVDQHSQRTYAQLISDAELIGGWTMAAGGGPAKHVALLMQHCAEYVIAQIGINMAGAAVFPLETHFGPKMLGGLMDDTQPIAGISSERFSDRLEAVLPSGTGDSAGSRVAHIRMGPQLEWRQVASLAASRAPPRSAWQRAKAYDTGIVTMTSGTSGKPKCIACPMIALAISVRARVDRYPYGDDEVEAANVMFPWEAVRPLCYGGVCLVVPDEIIQDTTQLATFLQQHGATRILTTPSLLATLLETSSGDTTGSPISSTLSKLKLWTLCGEVVPASLAQRCSHILPHATLLNDYSSWEGSDVSICQLPVGPTAATCAPAGAALMGVRAAVLDPSSRDIVPRGVVGELYVASPMLFTHYIGAPELTAQRLQSMPPAFLAASSLENDEVGKALAHEHSVAAVQARDASPSRHSHQTAAEWQPLAYRTGDLARMLPNGSIIILGRADSTIKIRGFKVGLFYVETTIGALPGVGRVAVVPLLDPETNQPVSLVAHLLPDSMAAADAAVNEKAWLASVRDAAKKELAQHALPTHWLLTKELAGSTSDGEARKLDRKKLPLPPTISVSKPARAPRAATAPSLLRTRLGSISPELALEEAMVPIWAELLNLEDDFDRNDSFFDLGGHSLLASKLVAAISSQLAFMLNGKSVTVLDLFDAPSLRALAAALTSRSTAATPPASQGPPEPMATPSLGDRTDLAIIGTAGKFPGAASVEELWSLLVSGEDALTRWTAETLVAKKVPADVRHHPDFVPAAYLISGAQYFDAGFWGISPQEARIMDPQHRVFMQVAWAALEDAGYAPRSGTPTRTAVFASPGIDGYLIHHLDGEPLKDTLNPGDIFLGEVGSEKDYISTRVSFALDLMGPSLAVNSACSSALAAVAQAAASLVSRQSDMALAGGSSLTFPGTGYLFEQGLVNSIDGKVRPFDAKAHGTVFGDAVGAVVMKRLADSISADDRVLAIIRGCGLTNDGSRKAGYAAPGVAGQVAAVTAALEAAGVSSTEVSYVECHATGTLVGDGIEVRALTEAFAGTAMKGAPRGDAPHCALGSIKGNIGHANAAAGVTGLIKAALCLSRRTLVPTAHFQNLNEKVHLDGGPFYVHTGATEWAAPANGAPRIAGVSSFGIGGTNVHVVLQEPPSAPVGLSAHSIAPCDRQAHVITISAKTAGALGRMASQLADHLQTTDTSLSLGRVAHTLHLGREAFAHRAFVVAKTLSGAIDELRVAATSAAEAAAAGHLGTARKPPAVVFIFPGQGSQCPRMGEGLYRGEPIFRQHIDRMCERLLPILGFDLRNELFPSIEAEHSPDFLAHFNTPIVTQPAIFVTELALGLTLLDLGVRPAGLAGHSIGEFVAATIAGVFDETDALELIAMRAKLSVSAPEGKMLAVNADEAVARSAAAAEPDELWLACLNAHGRQVLAGKPSSVDRAASELEAMGVRCRPLPVNRAYHTPLMAGVQAALSERLATMSLQAPAIPICCNGTGDWMTEATATDAAYWAAHVASAVRWVDNMESLASKAPAVVIEVGSGSTLAPLLAEAKSEAAESLQTLSTLRHPKTPFAAGLADQESFSEALGSLWENGVAIAWQEYHRGERYIKLPLPTYSFEPDVHWVNDAASMYVPPTEAELRDARAVLEAEAASATVGAASKANEDTPSEPVLVRLRDAPLADRKWATAYCLAYAGGSSAAFAELARAAPDWMDVIGVEMPGKGQLADVVWPAESEAAAIAPADDAGTSSMASASSSDDLTSLSTSAAAMAAGAQAEASMMERLADTIAGDAAGSAVVLIGWSMGGMLAAELAIELTSRGSPPQMLHVAGRMAPGSFIAAGDDVDKYLLASDEMKATEAWKEWLLPMLMADLRADARAEQRVAAAWSDAVARSNGTPPLSCVVQVCAGHEDAAFPPDAVGGWKPLSSGRFESHVLNGGHDILQRSSVELLRLIANALLPSTPLYAVKWEPVAAPTRPVSSPATSRAATPPTAASLSQPSASKGMQDLHATAPLTWRALRGELPPSEDSPLPLPVPPVASLSTIATSFSGAGSDDLSASDGASEELHSADMVTSSDDVEAATLAEALTSPLGLLLYVTAEIDVLLQERQCWELIRIVQRLVRVGAAGRIVIICPADAICGGLVGGASKAISLEAPEFDVQRIYVPEPLDILRSGGLFGGIESLTHGWLRWLGSIAATNLAEKDMWLDPSPPHGILAPRLRAHRLLPPSSAPAVDPAGIYLVTGGTGGVGGALVAWLLYEQHVPASNIVLISRRVVAPPHPGVQCVQADLSSLTSLAGSALRSLPRVDGIFHLAGVLDDGLIINMTAERLRTAVQPKAGVLSLLELCGERHWRPRWLLAASSTSSLLGYAGQSNYCAANGLLDQMATFGLPMSAQADEELPLVLTLNFGPWGEVGMAREGTKAHQLSLQSGELPMASSAAIACIADALRQLSAAALAGELFKGTGPRGTVCPPLGRGLQFAVADVEWWRSPWPSHPLLQGVMHRLPQRAAPAPVAQELTGPADEKPAAATKGMANQSDDQAHTETAGTDALTRVEAFLKNRISVWQPSLSLTELGLDSLDLVQLRNGFQKSFKLNVPLATFTNAQQTLTELMAKLSGRV